MQRESALRYRVQGKTMAVIALAALDCSSPDGSAARHDAGGAGGSETYPIDGQGLFDGAGSEPDASLDPKSIDTVERGDSRDASDADRGEGDQTVGEPPAPPFDWIGVVRTRQSFAVGNLRCT